MKFQLRLILGKHGLYRFIFINLIIKKPMGNCLYDPIKEYGLPFYEMWKYAAFSKRFLFEVPSFTNKIRIKMTEVVFGFVGITKVNVLVRS